ncbi:ABC transporter ATP-binding protein, partial [Ensifer sp. SSB1]|uniref:ABC transporter ATP-binding protein n=1 Tax=Ensifer sp. SSB1 TaxID=2795385 RepID=UPI001A530527
MTKLSIRDLHLSYGALPILKGISLDIAEGEIVVLLGPSGSGKTTLLRSIAGLESPDGGMIRVDGAPVFDAASKLELAPELRNFGFVFQSYALWPHRTVAENVGYGLKLRSVSAVDRSRDVADALAGLGLSKLADRYPHQLSGGQQQRVAIARAIVYNPPIILLDEPLSNLDAKLREDAKAWLGRLIREKGLSAVIVTHDQAEALALADRIVLLADGQIAQQGAPEQIYGNPETAFTAAFFGQNNVLRGSLDRSQESTSIVRGSLRLAGTQIGSGSSATGQAVIRVAGVRVVDEPG